MTELMTDINPRAQRFAEYREAIRELCRRVRQRVLDSRRAGGRIPRGIRQGADRRRLARGADPERVRRRRARRHRGVGHPGRDQSVGRQFRRLPRANVHHGHAAAARLRRRRSATTCPRIASGELRLQSFAVTEPTTGTDTTQIKTHRRRDRATATSSTVRRCGSRASSIRISCCSSRGRRRSAEVKKRPKGCPSFSSTCASRAATG